MNKKINLTCPNCKKIVEIDSKFKPFCSKACKSIDFLRWANEEVSIETFEDQDNDSVVLFCSLRFLCSSNSFGLIVCIFMLNSILTISSLKDSIIASNK